MSDSKSRHTWIDLLRGTAVIGMIWTHAANTFLDSSLQVTPTFQSLTYFHGLVAPTFIWLAGYMRGLASAKPGTPRPAWTTVKRLMFIWCIGVLMHMSWDWEGLIHLRREIWSVPLQFDVLQCLAASCLILLAIEHGFGRRKFRPWMAAGLLGLLVVVSTDAANASPSVFLPVDMMLSRRYGSLFPLFPWTGFAAFGFVAGALGRPMWRWAIPAIIVALVLRFLPIPGGTMEFFFERLGWVAVFAWIASHIEGWLRGHGLLLLAGRESLCMYVVHLVVIYSVPVWHGRTLVQALGTTQPVLNVIWIFLSLLLLSLLMAAANERRKQSRSRG